MWWLLACTKTVEPGGDSGVVLVESAPPVVETGADTAPAGAPSAIVVRVTLDDEPSPDTVVMQGGASTHVLTDADGRAELSLDPDVAGEVFVVASHPEARQGWDYWPDGDALTIALTRYDTADNPDYVFHPAGEDGTREGSPTTDYCGHCHGDFVEEFITSMHDEAASDGQVQDVYAGVATARDEDACAEVGGQWWTGLEPGTRKAVERCYVGHGVLPDLNEDCGDDGPCDDAADAYGGCADCHAPGIDGELGGRDLLEATGFAYRHGVHCDVCHKVSELDTEGEPGVAGWLKILRPSEESPTPAFDFYPITFCISHDTPNVRMGCVQRDHFQEGAFCGGCHQLDQEVLVSGASIDHERWPDGELPVHSTYEEWLDGPYVDTATCQSCHMPPNASLQNSIGLGTVLSGDPGYVNGSAREPGSIRHHFWPGAWHEDSSLLELAAQVEVEVTSGKTLEVEVVTRNTGPGHALPTGEPLRHLVLTVSATCDGELISPVGGDVVWDVGGGERRADGEDWELWPGAEVGQVLTVVSVDGWHDYTGHGAFGERFTAEEKGLPDEDWVGSATITAVDGEGRVTLDRPLPPGDAVYLADAWTLPEEGVASSDLAGHPGFAFARVMVGPDGERMTPHHRAVDLAVDNRLLPVSSWTSSHSFEGGCAEPSVEARLIYRAWPTWLADERGWPATDRVMAVGVP